MKCELLCFENKVVELGDGEQEQEDVAGIIIFLLELALLLLLDVLLTGKNGPIVDLGRLIFMRWSL